MEDLIHKIPLTEEFRVCPLCSYQDGFHSMLKRTGEEVHWLFICPSCRAVFDVGRTYRQ